MPEDPQDGLPMNPLELSKKGLGFASARTSKSRTERSRSGFEKLVSSLRGGFRPTRLGRTKSASELNAEA